METAPEQGSSRNGSRSARVAWGGGSQGVPTVPKGSPESTALPPAPQEGLLSLPVPLPICSL